MSMRAWSVAATSACLLASTVLSGCSAPLLGGQPEPIPIEVTGIHIGQEQRSGPTPGLYMGSLTFPICLRNPNSFDVWVERGYEVYQAIGPPDAGERRLVKRSHHGPSIFFANAETLDNGMEHHVTYNETMEGRETRYMIHHWHQIVDSKPIHRYDRWFNVTFTPYTSDTYYEEGKDC